MLAEMFGPKFLDDFGDAPTRMWKVAIAGLTDDQLQKGFARMLDQGRKWPPNVSEFVAECRHHDPVRYLGVPLTEEQKLTMLPAPGQIATPEVRNGALARIRKTLAGDLS